jgi:hypothetical protein
MESKKILIIVLILMAILTIGSVSASDNNINQTLTADEVQETTESSLDNGNSLGEMSKDDITIEVNDINHEEPNANFTEVSVTEKDGNFVICKGEGDEIQELYREDLSTSDKLHEDEGIFHLGVSFKDVNTFISDTTDESNFYDMVFSGDTLKFVLEYMDTDFIVKTYTTDIDDDNNVFFNEVTIGENDFDCWIASYASIDYRENHICNIYTENVNEGTIYLTITNTNGESRTYEKDIAEEKNEDNSIIWTLDELDILDELGSYTFNVRYNDELNLAEDYTFKLLKLNLNAYEGEIHINYPFSVLKIYDNEANVKVYVNDNQNPVENGWENPMGWNLDNLGIDSTGEYNITVICYEDDEIADSFTFTINVEDNADYFRLLAPFDQIESYDMENPVLYLLCPEGSEGTLILTVNDEPIEFEITSLWMNWTLDDLGIDHDDGYSIRIYNDTEEDFLTETWLNVWCIDETKIWSHIWNVDEDGKLYTDSDEVIVDVAIPEGKQGTIIVIVDENEFNWEIDEDYHHKWFLNDLDITDVGEYNITVKFIGEDEYEETINEATLNVVEFNNDTFRAVIDYTRRVVDFYCPEDSEGNVLIIVERWDEYYEDYVPVDEFNYEIDSSYYNQWTSFPFNELNVPQNTGLRIRFEISDDQYSYSKEGELVSMIRVDIRTINDNGMIYTDTKCTIINLYVSDISESGIAEIFVNGVSKVKSKVYSNRGDYEYSWTLNTLNITEPGEYDIVIKFTCDYGGEETLEYGINVVQFENDTFRAKFYSHTVVDDNSSIYFFCPENAQGTIRISLERWDEDEEEYIPDGEYTYEINSTMYNKWTIIQELHDENYIIDFRIDNEEIFVENERYTEENGLKFQVNDYEDLEPSREVVYIDIPYPLNNTNGTFRITHDDDEIYSIKLSELEKMPYEWVVGYDDTGCYRYAITFEDMDSFNSISDKDEIQFRLDVGKSMSYRWLPFNTYSIKKADGIIRLYKYEDLRIDLVKISLIETEDEEEQCPYNISDEGAAFATVLVPDYLNITETAMLYFNYGDHVYTKKITGLDYEYDYNTLSKSYNILLSNLNPENLKNKDVINITLKSNGQIIGYKTFICYFNDEGLLGFDQYYDSINIDFHYGQIGNSEYGMGIHDGTLMILTIPECLNISEGTIELLADDGSILFSKSLSEFEDNCTDYDGVQTYTYTILDDIAKFDYTRIPEGVNFTVAFTYENTTLLFNRGVRVGDWLTKIITPANVAQLFKITIAEEVLCDGEDNVITIAATDDANRQSIYIDLGGGYFEVYVNNEKIEDLGRLVRVDNEAELELFRLCSGNEGFAKLNIYLSDVNITENGIYNIRVTYVSDSEDFKQSAETELFNQNITLTSNVKVNYQNGTAKVFTGYGFDPVLLYLDTYYRNINETNGTITVLNSKGDRIFSKNIKDLKYGEGRYYLSYSDFENKDFGDNITVKYGNGNERSGETTLDVLWKDVESDDFTPTVKGNVEDYYGNFINLNIPDLINTGQIIATIKFKNKHNAPISNMNVTTDFDSQAVYKFNIADIKTNYNNDFSLALSDLGFYEDNGNYEILVQFTADGTDTLDITNNTVNVEFLKEISLTVNETSRYSLSLPFASARVYEPITAYSELYIDGVLYSHKTFEKGLINFDSAVSWTPGNHTAELIVYNSEFGTILNSTTLTFETLTNTKDIDVNINDTVKENEKVFVTISVPKEGEATIQIDNGESIIKKLTKGLNTLDLGVLSYGNHTIWISYNATLDDGNISFYNNYLSVFVGDDGHWIDFPQPLVLEDDDTIRLDLGPDAEGYILVKIDGKLISNMTLVNGTASVTLNDLIFGEQKYGTHTYNITYSGDEKHDSLSKAGSFNVTYLFKDDIDKEGYPLKETYAIVIYLPENAKGTASAEIAGKTYTEKVKDGKVTFNINNIAEGENNIRMSYSGDDIYPAKSYDTVLNVTYYAVIGEVSAGNRYVSLMLPANATGNLTVYNDNRHAVLFTKNLENGKMSIDLNNLPVGIYDIRAYYEGNDYDVRTFNGSFKVMPKVSITQDVVIGENATITMDLNEASGSILIVFDGLSPVLQDIDNGKVNYTFSTEDMSYGNHTINFQYFGTSFDSTVFYDLNEQTGRYVPVDYMLSTLPKIVPVKLDSDETTAYISVGNATGTIEVFVNGVLYAIVNITNGIASLDLSKFKNGDYVITWKYYGDDKYAPFTKSETITINNKIVANNMKMLYTSNGKYSAKVYGLDGKIVKNIKVTFIINGKNYGNAKTNKKGIATITIKKNPGTYKITTKALGVSITKKLTVDHVVTLKKVSVKKSAKKLVLTATLKKVNKKYLKGKKVTFKFNGKKYTAKTNKKGVAKVTIKKSVLKKLKVGKKVKYQATYRKDTVQRTVKIKK